MLTRNFIEIVFSLSLFFNAFLFIPQAFKIYKNKNVQGLSLLTFGGFNIMQIFTVMHGYLVKDYLLMIGFLLSFLTCGVVTTLVVVYKFRNS